MMYYKEENGKRIWLHNILILDNKQIINPTEDQILAAGYIKYEKQETQESLSQVLQNKIQEILEWDSSTNVNLCYINHNGHSFPYWASKEERNDLKAALNDCLNIGRDIYRLDLRDINVSITTSCDQLLQVLSALEVYAIDCYNKTTDHIYAVKNLSNLEDIQNYNYTEGYPEKLIFEL